MASISEKTAKELQETDNWLAEQAAERQPGWIKTYGVIPFVVTLAIGYAVVHFAL